MKTSAPHFPRSISSIFMSHNQVQFAFSKWCIVFHHITKTLIHNVIPCRLAGKVGVCNTVMWTHKSVQVSFMNITYICVCGYGKLRELPFNPLMLAYSDILTSDPQRRKKQRNNSLKIQTNVLCRVHNPNLRKRHIHTQVRSMQQIGVAMSKRFAKTCR